MPCFCTRVAETHVFFMAAYNHAFVIGLSSLVSSFIVANSVAGCYGMQVLQKAAQWCPNPDKVFVNAAGQLVEPQEGQQQPPAAAQTNSARSAAGKLDSGSALC